MKQMPRSDSIQRQGMIPAEMRRRLGAKPGDEVGFRRDNGLARIIGARSAVDESFQSVPVLDVPLSWKDPIIIAIDEHAREAATEGF